MTDLRVIGVDPGPTPGIVLLDYANLHRGHQVFFPNWRLERVEAIQCTAGVLEEVLRPLVTSNLPLTAKVLVAAEKFIVGNRTHRSSTPQAGRQTAEQVEELKALCEAWETKLYLRRAADVKPWATAGTRLAQAGLLEPTKGLTHARSAAWHALFCAVHDGGVPDPLSAKK